MPVSFPIRVSGSSGRGVMYGWFRSELTDFDHTFSDPVGAQIMIFWLGFVIQPHDGLLNIRGCTKIKYGV